MAQICELYFSKVENTGNQCTVVLVDKSKGGKKMENVK